MTVPQNDRLKSGLEKFIRAVLGPRIDYLASWPAVVKAQNADGSLDLQPDDPRLPGVQGIPIAYGIPGIAVTVKTGSRVSLSFAAGDPSKPRATVWDSSSVGTVIVIADQTIGGTPPSITLVSPIVKLGSSGASQPFVLGTSYQTHMTALATALQTLQVAITPLMLPPAAAAAKAAALAAYNAATSLAADLSTTVKGQ